MRTFFARSVSFAFSLASATSSSSSPLNSSSCTLRYSASFLSNSAVARSWSSLSSWISMRNLSSFSLSMSRVSAGSAPSMDGITSRDGDLDREAPTAVLRRPLWFRCALWQGSA